MQPNENLKNLNFILAKSESGSVLDNSLIYQSKPFISWFLIRTALTETFMVVDILGLSCKSA